MLGEELGDDSQGSRYRWVIDPIDGTLAFSRGLPTFGTLLAFEDTLEKKALVGVIHLPAMGETYSAARGVGAWCNGGRLHVAPARPLRDCIISAPAEHYFRLAGIADERSRVTRASSRISDASQIAGHTRWSRAAPSMRSAEFRLARWDIAATEVVVEEAGGRALIWEATHAPGRYDCIIGSPSAADEVASIIRRPRA